MKPYKVKKILEIIDFCVTITMLVLLIANPRIIKNVQVLIRIYIITKL